MNQTILIVEDHEVVRRSLRDWLNMMFHEYRVLEAASGEEALGIVTATPPRLILMDVGLPAMTGIEATRHIRKTAPQLPIVILSIHESPEHAQAALAAGANAYVFKRKLHSDLYAVLARLLNNGHAHSA